MNKVKRISVWHDLDIRTTTIVVLWSNNKTRYRRRVPTLWVSALNDVVLRWVVDGVVELYPFSCADCIGWVAERISRGDER